METLLIAFLPIILPIIAIVLFYRYREKKLDEEFLNSEYARNTNKTRRETLSDKGSNGEYQIFNQVDPLLSGTKFWLFNVYIPRGHGKTTEIDAILFHDSGIYIFESKNYKGWIFGHEEHETWTQCLRSSGRHSKKFTFFNPLMQNNIHIEAFKAWAGTALGNIPIRSFVIFGDKCQLKNITLTSGKHYVLNQHLLPNLLKHLTETLPPVDAKTIINLYNRAYPLTQVDTDTKVQHVVTVQSQSHIHRREKNSHPHSQANQFTCPRCGNRLVRRVAKRGPNRGQAFLGCSNYPNCRYTKPN